MTKRKLVDVTSPEVAAAFVRLVSRVKAPRSWAMLASGIEIDYLRCRGATVKLGCPECEQQQPIDAIAMASGV